jgi:hypothetical protein
MGLKMKSQGLMVAAQFEDATTKQRGGGRNSSARTLVKIGLGELWFAAGGSVWQRSARKL